jgi:predicted HAD superfamily Cof-like phosphohydrolase
MQKQIEQVREFYAAFGVPHRTDPALPGLDRLRMRAEILFEEVAELEEAALKGDMVETADAIIDCMYILIGHALEFGLADKLPALFDEVHRSNMSKLGPDGRPIYRQDGKVLKGPNYSPPDLKTIIEQ